MESSLFEKAHGGRRGALWQTAKWGGGVRLGDEDSGVISVIAPSLLSLLRSELPCQLYGELKQEAVSGFSQTLVVRKAVTHGCQRWFGSQSFSHWV